MFGFAWSELILIGAVALVVIGPKDLPRVMRTAGQWSRKLRFLASDFQRHVDEMVRQAELDEVKRTAEKAMDVGSIGADIEKAVGVAEIEKSLSLDEPTAAANVPVLPAESVPSIPPPTVEPPMESTRPAPVATNAAAVGMSELPAESVASMAPSVAAPNAEPAMPEEAPGSIRETKP